jgi:hypothetical protein
MERYRILALVLRTPERSQNEFHMVLLQSLRSNDVNAALRQTRGELARARDVVVEHFLESMTGGARTYRSPEVSPIGVVYGPPRLGGVYHYME